MIYTNESTSGRVWTEGNMTAPVTVQGNGFEVSLLTNRQPDKIDPSDDAAMIYQWADGACVVAVADGVGGAPLGNQASSVAMRCLMEHLDAANPLTDLRPWILDAIEQANAEILDCQSGSATTLTIAEIRDQYARTYQVGDSMAVILSSHGKVKYRTVCHSPVGYAVESGYLEDDEAIYHDDRHYLSNMVGCKEMSIDVGPVVPLAKRDSVLLGSDGLFDNLAFDEIIDLARKGKVDRRVDGLATTASRRMLQAVPGQPSKPDDLTVLMWRRCR